MGNTPSSEAYRKPQFPYPSTLAAPPLYSSPTPHASSSAHPPPVDAALAIPPPVANKLTKSRTRPRPRSTADLLKGPRAGSSSAVPVAATRPVHARHSINGLALGIPSVSSTSSSSALALRPLPPLPLGEEPTSPKSPLARSSPVSPTSGPVVFTFDETPSPAAFGRPRDAGFWQPMTSVYTSPDMGMGRQQQQQQQQWRQQQEYLLSEQHKWTQQQQPLDQNFAGERQPRKWRRQQTGQKRNLFRSKSTQRSGRRYSSDDDDDNAYRRRNSIGSVSPYTGKWQAWDGVPLTYEQALGQYYEGAESRPLPAGKHTSCNYNLSSYEAKRLLHLVEDSMPPGHQIERSSATSESKFSHASEVIGKSSHQPQPQPQSPTLARANSDLSLYAPIRRRSVMQVPGVATRRNSMPAGDGSVSRPNFRHSRPVTPPSLSQRASLESMHSNHMPSTPPPLPRVSLLHEQRSDADAPRVSTPCDKDYQAIGAFKLGSLRITNGAASPVSSPETARTCKHNDGAGDAVDTDMSKHSQSLIFDFAARTQALAALSGNGIEADDNDDGMDGHRFQNKGTKARQKARYTLGSGSLLSASPPVFQSSPVAAEDRAREPEKRPFMAESVAEMATRTAVGTMKERTTKTRTKMRTKTRTKTKTETFPRVDLPQPLELPQIELSSDLFSGFEFSFSEFSLVEQEDTSTAAAPAQATAPFNYATAEVLDVRLDPSAKSTARRSRIAGLLSSRKSDRSGRSVARSDSGFVSASPASDRSSRQKPLSKADSGYSSNVSLRSIKQAASKLMTGPVAVKTGATASPCARETFLMEELKLPSPVFDGADKLQMSGEMRLARAPDSPRIAFTTPSPSPPCGDSLPPASSPSWPLPSPSSSLNIQPAHAVDWYPDVSSHLYRKRHTLPPRLAVTDNTQNTQEQDSGGIGATTAIADSGLPAATTETNIGVMSRSNKKLLRLLSFGGGGGGSAGSAATAHSSARDENPRGSAAMRKRLPLRRQGSKDMLKSVFNVGHAETAGQQDRARKGKGGSEMQGGRVGRNNTSRRHTLQHGASPMGHVAEAMASVAAVAEHEDEQANLPPSSASSQPMNRAMSLTAQLERSLNVRLSFSKLFRSSTAEGMSSATATTTAAAAAEPTMKEETYLPPPMPQQRVSPRADLLAENSLGDSMLRHRASYEGYGSYRGAWSPPVYRPAGQPEPQQPQQLQQQSIHYQQYMPREQHSRHRSTGSDHSYRVLHSYNSPAYRNVPIWG